MEYPVKKHELLKPNLIQRIFKTVPKRIALIELTNFIAAGEPKELELPTAEQILGKYRFDARKVFKSELLRLFRDFILYYLADLKLSSDEKANLSALKALFNLKDKEVQQIFADVGKGLYKQEVEKAVADGQLTEDERKHLAALKQELTLEETLADKIYKSVSSTFYTKKLSDAMADERISADEEKELAVIRESLGITDEPDEYTKGLYDRYKLYWLIENGDIPAIAKDQLKIHLPRGEECYFISDIVWNEPRRRKYNVSYGGMTYRYKIAKGLYFRMGSLDLKPMADEEMTPIDSGTLYLTNRRLIFMGARGSKNIKLQRILDLELFKDGVLIKKDAGKSPFLKISKDIDIFSGVLKRLLSEV